MRPLMDPIGQNIASSASAAKQAERNQSTRARRVEDARQPKRAEDEAEIQVDQVEAPEAVRSLKGNADEESHEDRLEHGVLERYDQSGKAAEDEEPPRLDVKV